MSSIATHILKWLAAVCLLLACARLEAAAGSLESSLLFVGLTTGDTISVSAVDVNALRGDLVGIMIDGREIAMEVTYLDGDTYYLPADLLTRMGIKGTAEGDRLLLDTPGGTVEAPRQMFRSIDGVLYFADSLLDQVLKIRWEFSKEKYAFTMTLPWWERSQPVQENVFSGEEGGTLITPSKVGLTQVRLDHSQYFDQNSRYGQSNLLLRGRAFEGIWRGELVAREDRPTKAEDYYWLRDFEQMQALVGHQQILINPLLPSFQNTGAQALYSSDGIEFDPYQDQTRNQYIRRFGIPAKDIEGVAQPGAIAELRVDDRPIARVRVNLDGTYRFSRVRSNSLQFQTVRVHILDQRSRVELETQDFTRTPLDLLLDKKQTVAFAGAGAHGNPLDSVMGTDGAAAFGLVRHGITDRLTVEAGLQSAGDKFFQMAGVSTSLGRNWAASATLGHREGGLGHSVDVFGRADRWYLNVRSQQHGEGFRTEDSMETSSHELRYEYLVNRRLSMGFHGRARDTGSSSNEYLLPGMTWRFGERNVLKVWPDFDGSYRVDVRTMHRERDWFELVADSTGERAEYRYFRNQNHEFFGRLSRYDFDGDMLAEVGSIWYPNRYDDRSLLSASVLGGNDGLGARFTWQTTVLPGLFSQLEVRNEPVATEFVDPGLQVRWTLSVDLSIADGRPVPARNDFLQPRLGSIAGRLILPDGANPAQEDMDRITLLLDGRPQTAVLRGKHFFIRNIPPGTYEVSLGSEYLPMSLSPVESTYRVKVVPAATSTVDFVVQREYGLAGQVLDGEGLGIGSVPITVFDSAGEIIARSRTDSFGYYRIAELVPGIYEVHAAVEDGTPLVLKVEILDAYLFDADLSLSNPPPETETGTSS